jgi:CHAT domain-containing protein
MKRAIVLVLAAAVIGGAVIAYGMAGRRGSLMRQLARSTPERTFAARTSIDAEYHKCERAPAKVRGETVPRESCAKPGKVPLKPRALESARQSPDPDSLQAWALSTVIWWDSTDVSPYEAISRLEKALRLSPGSVPLLVDLSAAHLARAEWTQNSRDLIQALNYAEEALAREPRNARARFNAALALQAFGLDRQADKAWSAYLATDSTTEWADEARERKERLITHVPEILRPAPGASDSVVQTFATNHPQEARELGWDSVLGEWGGAVEAGNAAHADSLLNFAATLGQALERRPGGDASLTAAVSAIRRVAGDAAATAALARAHRVYADARANIKAVNYKEARDAFAHVVSYQPPSPVLLQWATAFLAATGGYDQTGDAQPTLGRLLDGVDTTHPVLAGRARMALGRALLREGEYPKAHVQYRVAQELFRSAGETELNAFSISTVGEAAYESGDTVEGYRLMHRAQLALRSYGRSQPLHINLIALGWRTIRDEMPRAALSVYNEAIEAATRTGADVNVFEALQYRAQARAIVNDSLGAARDLDSALVWSRKLPPPSRERVWAEAMIRLAKPGRFSAPAAMDSTIKALSHNVLWLLPALLWRADALLAESDLPGAIAGLDSVTAHIQRLSKKESDARLRSAMIEQVRKRFDQLLMLHLQQNRPEEALRVLERGRVSFDRQWDSVHVTLKAPPPGQTVVDYALIGDTLVAWIIRPDSPMHMVRRTVDRDTFRLTVEQVGATLESATDEDVARPGLRRLYDWLIGPIRERLGPENTTLVIVADGEVAGVPFEALWDSAGGRYLVDDHPLRFAATLADAVRPPAPERARSGPALLVADPAFDRPRHPTLELLPGARIEVDALQDFYRGARVLREDAAARDTFIALAQRAEIIHYAGHAVFDDARPERSFLLLAGADTTGRLTAQAIDSMELRGAPLVVLSACRTLRSRAGRSGGFVGLSGSLLTAGASGVVGSLWQADDELTQPLMLAFHKHYRSLRDPARALQAAQREMIRQRDPRLHSPAAWAGFRYMGN